MKREAGYRQFGASGHREGRRGGKEGIKARIGGAATRELTPVEDGCPKGTYAS